MSRQSDFIAQLAPMAQEIGAKYGIDPRIIIAQAALETGWGRSLPQGSNNVFGVKDFSGGGVPTRTHEMVNGQMVPTTANFRQYDSVRSSMEDYARLIGTDPRYAAIPAATTLQGQVEALGASPYATDEDYGTKIGQLVRQIDVQPLGNPFRTSEPPSPANRGTALDAVNEFSGQSGTPVTYSAYAQNPTPSLRQSPAAPIPASFDEMMVARSPAITPDFSSGLAAIEDATGSSLTPEGLSQNVFSAFAPIATVGDSAVTYDNGQSTFFNSPDLGTPNLYPTENYTPASTALTDYQQLAATDGQVTTPAGVLVTPGIPNPTVQQPVSPTPTAAPQGPFSGFGQLFSRGGFGGVLGNPGSKRPSPHFYQDDKARNAMEQLRLNRGETIRRRVPQRGFGGMTVQYT